VRAEAEVPEAEIKVLTFDQYGTLVDMQSGLVEAATPYLRRKGWAGDPGRFVTWWRRTHFENSMIDALIDRGHTSYREIGHRSVAYTLERAGIAYTADEVAALVAAIESLRPFPDVVPALDRLRRRYPLAILSNGDPDMLAAARRHIGFDFDATISVAAAGYFKPHPRAYARAAEMLEVPIGQIMHVASHPFDCLGAKAAGMKAAFVNRRRRPFGETPFGPDLTVSSFDELAVALA
jgi:2-haloacid dehalogenase